MPRRVGVIEHLLVRDCAAPELNGSRPPIGRQASGDEDLRNVQVLQGKVQPGVDVVRVAVAALNAPHAILGDVRCLDRSSGKVSQIRRGGSCSGKDDHVSARLLEVAVVGLAVQPCLRAEPIPEVRLVNDGAQAQHSSWVVRLAAPPDVLEDLLQTHGRVEVLLDKLCHLAAHATEARHSLQWLPTHRRRTKHGLDDDVLMSAQVVKVLGRPLCGQHCEPGRGHRLLRSLVLSLHVGVDAPARAIRQARASDAVHKGH
mmetsp:Transcript_88506/g.268340  ORF Transcript_88506/g.268340 Transcript_88506/m.268340 type:complete len:258 (-) Transcript_88506:434-1207(-)